MKLPEWIQEKDTQVYAIPKGAIGHAHITDGRLHEMNTLNEAGWQEAWERLLINMRDGDTPHPVPKDGRVWLVERECDADVDGHGQRWGCEECHGTGYIHDLVPEDAEEVRTNRALMMDWGQKGPLGWITFIMQDNLDAAGLRFINKTDGKKYHDIWREKE